jgi:hypothetical protein
MAFSGWSTSSAYIISPVAGCRTLYSQVARRTWYLMSLLCVSGCPVADN